MSISQNKTLLLGDKVPDFEAQTTMGKIHFYDWLGKSWCLFFSHPKDFTPVCTTELGQAARLKSDFDVRNVKVISLSVDSVENHKKWIKDINETQKVVMNFPMIADENKKISELFGMIHPKENETSTVRTVFIIDPLKKLRMYMAYPTSTGRNFAEIIRVIDAIQLSEKYPVSTPEGWKNGENCIINPSITDPEELKEKFPYGWKELKPYLRITRQPD